MTAPEQSEPGTVERGVRDAFDLWLSRAGWDLVEAVRRGVGEGVGVAVSTPSSDFPVAVGDVVALGLSPTPAGDQACPVGMVTAVGPLGVTLAHYHWVIETFAGGRELVAWSRVLGCWWAETDADGVFVMDPLADFQTRWKRGAEYLRERERADEEAAR